MTNFEMVREFHATFDLPDRKTPGLLETDEQKLRLSLIEEEVDELKTGIFNKDIVEIADALTDILYVVYGAALCYGLDIDLCFKEVHRSNMSKLGSDGNPLYREDGKVLKGPNYSSPDLGAVLYSPETSNE